MFESYLSYHVYSIRIKVLFCYIIFSHSHSSLFVILLFEAYKYDNAATIALLIAPATVLI